jgi:DNA-binding sugar fermentation-stimulating protein
MILINFTDYSYGNVVKRPSKSCKTPYVADVILENEETEILAHSPALGCCGLSDKDSSIIVTPIKNKNKNAVCSHRIQLAKYEEEDKEGSVIVGINPKLAETIAEECIKNNCLSFLQNVISYSRETKILNSRFDFTGLDENGTPFIMEIKNVPLAYYVDVPNKERKNHKEFIDSCDFNDKIAYFPDGYRKAKKDIVSPRALKHIQELEEIKKTSITRCILCFVVQRSDVKYFQPSNLDPTYKEAVRSASKNGVEIRVIKTSWDNACNCKFVCDDLPVCYDMK